jgi:hypothetical protein
MNRQILKQYIHEYKTDFERVNQQEIYKWKAVKCFQDNWNIEATNFLEMLSQSIRLTQNLLKSGQYFPLRMLVHYATQRPEELRQLFRILYDEENDIYQRIQDFQNGTDSIHNSIFSGRDLNTYQDPRAIIVYLTLRYPERYFFYKFEMFKQFSERLELTYRPTKGRIENIGHFNSLCEIVRYELSNDQELLQLHKDRITADCYHDISLNILTQDFIYAVERHLNQQTPVPVASTFQTAIEVSATNLSTSTDQLTFRGRTVNFIQNNIDNKRIGDLGELWVLKYEIEKLRQSGRHNLVGKIKHTAKDEGDGTGYDIQSFDGNGQKIYIEVKTTKGGKNSTFYITRTELERSKIEKENFYLYRLYNFNEDSNTAEILIIKGDLTNLCEFPTTYKINLTND